MRRVFLSRVITYIFLFLITITAKAQDEDYWFIVNVTPEYHPYNVWYLNVDLIPEGTDKPYATEPVNEDYNAEFKNVPAGKYTVSIKDANQRGLQNYSSTVEIKPELQHLNIVLGEFLVAPFDIKVGEPVLTADDKFDVNITWNDGGKVHLPYMFDLQLNGEGSYSTSGYNYPFEGLDAGKYTITIWGETPSFQNTPPASVEFSLPPSLGEGNETAVEAIRVNDNFKSVYNLNGNKITTDNIKPGIYIVKTKSETKKVQINR